MPQDLRGTPHAALNRRVIVLVACPRNVPALSNAIGDTVVGARRLRIGCVSPASKCVLCCRRHWISILCTVPLHSGSDNFLFKSFIGIFVHTHTRWQLSTARVRDMFTQRLRKRMYAHFTLLFTQYTPIC